MKVKPIDKSKKSNRRCCNCEYYPKEYSDESLVQCQRNVRKVHYWNCCYQFEWSSRKTYKEQDDATD
ncbi:MAG: hypothetical protein IIY21_02840 [Clostridiales bacterium]|nr:hypothetical protein [Clostridiales bacterium]